MEEQWPIRVGGEYRPRSGSGLSLNAMVTEVANGIVYFDLVFADGRRSSPACDVAVKTFYTLFAPEDQSPLPAVQDFLEAIVIAESLQGHWLVRKAQELLDKMKAGVHVP